MMRVGLPQAAAGLQGAYGHGNLRDFAGRGSWRIPLALFSVPCAYRAPTAFSSPMSLAIRPSSAWLKRVCIHLNQHVGELRAADHVEHARGSS